MISIITRTKNRPLAVKRLYENLKSMTNSSFEWVIVNDNGSREFEKFINPINDPFEIKIIHNNESKGRSYPANVGVQNAKYDFCLILDDDDYLAEDFFDVLIENIKSNPNIDVFLVNTQVIYEIIDENGNFKKISNSSIYNPNIKDYIPEFLFYNNPSPTCGVIFKKSLYLEVGGYPEDVEYTEDWCCYFLMSFKAKFFKIDKVLAFYSHRKSIEKGEYQNSFTSDRLEQNHLSHSIYWKNKFLEANPNFNLRLIRQIINDQINNQNKILNDFISLRNSLTFRVGEWLLFPIKLFVISYYKLINIFKKSKKQ